MSVNPIINEIRDDEKNIDLDCSICKQTIKKVQVLLCSHYFCTDCFAQWNRTQPTCPFCRAVSDKVPDGSKEGYLERMQKAFNLRDRIQALCDSTPKDVDSASLREEASREFPTSPRSHLLALIGEQTRSRERERVLRAQIGSLQMQLGGTDAETHDLRKRPQGRNEALVKSPQIIAGIAVFCAFTAIYLQSMTNSG